MPSHLFDSGISRAWVSTRIDRFNRSKVSVETPKVRYLFAIRADHIPLPASAAIFTFESSSPSFALAVFLIVTVVDVWQVAEPHESSITRSVRVAIDGCRIADCACSGSVDCVISAATFAATVSGDDPMVNCSVSPSVA